LLATSALVCALGIWLPASPLAGAFGFVALPARYWLVLPFLLCAYLVLVQAVKGRSVA
jgi:Mg2+-importing ATPase